MPLLHSSGGLVYHLRAWRWQQLLWQPFHEVVETWLNNWLPASTKLVLIGPSAGYLLNAGFLARYPRIDVLEPEPLARLLLRRRFPQQRFHFGDSIWLARLDGFDTLSERYPDSAFLFCNLLGQQLVGAAPQQDRQIWLQRLQTAMHNHAWASWHDLVSTERAPDRQTQVTRPCAEPLDDVISRFWRGGELEIHDHESMGIRPDRLRQYAIWQLAPKRYHLIEWLAAES